MIWALSMDPPSVGVRSCIRPPQVYLSHGPAQLHDAAASFAPVPSRRRCFEALKRESCLEVFQPLTLSPQIRAERKSTTGCLWPFLGCCRNHTSYYISISWYLSLRSVLGSILDFCVWGQVRRSSRSVSLACVLQGLLGNN